MRHLIKNTRGMTLIEVIATLVIAFIIATFIYGIIQSSTDQKIQQTKEADNLFDITYALKVVTKDIRRSIDATAAPSQMELILTLPNKSTLTYFTENGQLKKKFDRGKTESITDGIGCAQFKSTSTIISIKLGNSTDCSKSKETEIHLRKGS